jgi:dTDP-4-dehydrorhamnose reductase
MRILVLGKNGQLGTCLFDQFKGISNEVIFMSRSEIDLCDMNVSKIKILKINPQIIINASAYTEVDKAENEEQEANKVNHLAVSKIAAICLQIDCWFIHISTDYVFDGHALKPYKETDITNPKGVYGKSKLNGEKEIIASSCKYIIIRTSWIFSEYGKNFMKTMLELGNTHKEISVVADQFGCPTYAQDIAKAIVSLVGHIQTTNLRSSIYHFSGDEICSWHQFATTIFLDAKKFRYKTPDKVKSISTDEYPTLAKRPIYSVLNTSKLENELGIGPSNWRKSIKDVLKALNTQN